MPAYGASYFYQNVFLMKLLSALFVALCLATTGLQAEPVYVFFDASCSDQVLYDQEIRPGTFVDYVAYHLPLSGNDQLILEVGNPSGQTLNYVPEGTLFCGDPRLNAELANRINAGKDQVFIVQRTAQSTVFLIDPVTAAATLEYQGSAFNFNSSLTGFQFDLENGIIGENLAYNNPGAKVYFEGREAGPCSGTFMFRQLKPNTTYPVVDLKVIPEIGIIERRLGSDGVTNNPGGTIFIRSVNGEEVTTYLNRICAPEATAAPTLPAPTAPAAVATYSNQPVYTAPTVPATAQPESAAVAVNPPTVTTSVTHTVAKGETLYAISRKYGTSVAAVKSSNGLSGNVVYPGQQLTVMTTQQEAVAMAPQPTASAAPAATVPTLPYSPGNIASSNPGAAAPTPYGATQAPKGYSVYGEDIHVVQPGETVASLALKYGYTSAKFRELNGLGPNDVVRVGEQLKTTDCDCPELPAATPAAPSSYGTAPAAPQAFVPQATQQVARPQTLQPQPSGVPVNAATVPTYTPAAELPQTAPTISNNPNFGQVVPNTAAAPTTTLNQLESRSGAVPTSAPAGALGARPAGIPVTAPAAAPATYGSAPASPTTFGTPLGAAAAANQPSTAPVSRSFHVVQAGETPAAIARRYNLTVDKLLKLNDLKPTDVVVPFQKLYVN